MNMEDYYGGYDEYGYDDYYGGEDKNTSPALELSDDSDLEAFLADNEESACVVGFFGTEEYNTDFDKFMAVSEELGYRFRFAYTKEPEMLESRKYKGSAVLVYLARRHVNLKLEKPKKRFPAGKMNMDLLKKFIAKAAVPLVGEFSWTTEEDYTKSIGLPIVVLFADVQPKDKKNWDYLANRMRRIAQNYKDKLSFAIASKKPMNSFVKEHDLDLKEKHSLGVGIRAGHIIYSMKEEFSFENVQSFVEDYIAGKLQGKQVDKPPPRPPRELDVGDSKVIEATEDNFQEEVMATDANVMLEFYAPWCGHCKSLKPEYEELAERFAGDDKVDIVAYNAADQQVPSGFQVKSYPTLVFLRAGDKSQPLPYDGPRTADDMEKFIKKHKLILGRML